MLTQRKRAVVWAVASLAGIWLLAAAGFWIADAMKVTAEKVRAYVAAVDLNKLSAAARAKALQNLAAKINALSLEERQQMRLDQSAYRWFDQMTEEEKGTFLEATMPHGLQANDQRV